MEAGLRVLGLGHPEPANEVKDGWNEAGELEARKSVLALEHLPR